MAADVTIISSAARKHAIPATDPIDLADNCVIRIELALAAIAPVVDARNVRTNPHTPYFEAFVETAPSASGPWRRLTTFEPGEVTEKTGDEGARGWPAGKWRRSVVADQYVRGAAILRYAQTNLEEADKVAVTAAITARAVGSAT